MTTRNNKTLIGDTQSVVLNMQLREAVEQLRNAIHRLYTQLGEEQHYPAWAAPLDPDKNPAAEPITAAAAREGAREMIRNVIYEDDQDAHRTEIYPAVVGCSAKALEAGHQLNQAKDLLAKALRACDPYLIEVTDPTTQVTLKVPLTQKALENLHLSRMHRRQALRKLVIVDEPVRGITYKWNNLPKLQRISVEEARTRLLHAKSITNSAREADLRRLEPLPDDEILILYGPPHRHPRATITPVHGRIAIKVAVLPILIPSTPGGRLPHLVPLPADRET